MGGSIFRSIVGNELLFFSFSFSFFFFGFGFSFENGSNPHGTAAFLFLGLDLVGAGWAIDDLISRGKSIAQRLASKLITSDYLLYPPPLPPPLDSLPILSSVPWHRWWVGTPTTAHSDYPETGGQTTPAGVTTQPSGTCPFEKLVACWMIIFKNSLVDSLDWWIKMKKENGQEKLKFRSK